MHQGGERRPVPRSGMAVVSLVSSVVYIPLWTMGFFGAAMLACIVAVVMGIVGWVSAARAPHLFGGKAMAAGGLALAVIPVLVFALGVWYWHRVPASRTESGAIGNIREFISAEARYQSASGGYYGTPKCLVAPATCSSVYEGVPSSILDPADAVPVKGGYVRTFHPGPAASPEPGAPAEGRLTGYAYVAVPEQPGRTGVRGFCGDATGRICYTTDGSAPPVKDGQCDPCRELR